MRRSGIEVWPATTDLMAGIALLLLVFVLVLRVTSESERVTSSETNRTLQQERDTLRRQFTDLQRRLEAADELSSKLAADNAALKRRIDVLLPTATTLPPQSEPIIGIRQQLVERLRTELEGANIKVDQDALSGTLRVQGETLFELGRHELPETGDARQRVRDIGRAVVRLLQDKETARKIAQIEVIGHADQIGSFPGNRLLSRDRAVGLVDLWVREAGDDPAHRCVVAKLVAYGVGSTNPLIREPATAEECGNPPDDPATPRSESRGCAKNRRIDIRIIPKEPSWEEVKDCP